MIGIDTNILVRFLTRDDPVLTVKADALMASLSRSARGYVATAVVVELIRVVRRNHGATRAETAQIVEKLIASDELVVESRGNLESALQLLRTSSGEFPDCLILRACQNAGCHPTVTFDRQAARSIGMKLAL